MSSAVCSDPIQCMQELTLGKAKSPSIAFQGHSYPHRTKGCTRTHLVVVRAFQALSTSPHKLADLFFLHLAMKWWCQLQENHGQSLKSISRRLFNPAQEECKVSWHPREDADALESPEVKSAFELYRLKSWLSCLIHFDPDL